MNVYSFEVGEKTYQARFTIESLMKLEEWTGKGVAGIADESTFGMTTIVNLLRAGLYWKDKGITQQRAIRIYSDFSEQGGNRKELFNNLIDIYSKSINTYLPTDEEDDEGND